MAIDAAQKAIYDQPVAIYQVVSGLPQRDLPVLRTFRLVEGLGRRTGTLAGIDAGHG